MYTVSKLQRAHFPSDLTDYQGFGVISYVAKSLFLFSVHHKIYFIYLPSGLNLLVYTFNFFHPLSAVTGRLTEASAASCLRCGSHHMHNVINYQVQFNILGILF